ncbi:MAG: hypothetical protein ACYDG4_16615 [Desulfuromonadaceae bacterium]
MKVKGEELEAAFEARNVSTALLSREAELKNIEKNGATAQREKEAAIANVYEMAGKIKTTNFFKTQADFFNLLMLKKVKDSKEYRERAGLTWEQFCDHIGVNRRTVDRQLEDLEPFRVEFLDTFANFSGVTINKIKYLGIAVNEKLVTVSENAITINGETIPLDAEHKDDIQAILETLEEDHRKKTEELEASLSASKKVAAAKEKVINTLERDLKRLEKRIDLSDLTDEEQDAINLLNQVQMDFQRGMSDIKKAIEPHKAPAIALRSYYFLLLFVQKFCTDEREALNETYREADECPWDIMDQEIPDSAVVVDNLPCFVGQGIGVLYQAKIDARKAKAEARKKGKAEKEGGTDGTN